MRAVVQRVHEAAVVVNDCTVGGIGKGLLVYLGVGSDDRPADSDYLAEKVRYLRIFPDDHKPLNRDVVEAEGGILVISAFTTQADARKGRRPALTGAAEPQLAEELYEQFCKKLETLGVKPQTGQFREHMDVSSVNDGPICILLDSGRQF